MTILLTQAIQVAGVTQPAGTTLTLEAGLEADLVTRKCATFVSRSTRESPPRCLPERTRSPGY